jgi:AraC-like DNA-binding protein
VIGLVSLDEGRCLKETSWTYLAATPCKTAQAWGCAFGGFSEYAAGQVHRLELPVAGALIVLCCGEPVTLQPALRAGGATRSSAFFAGLQVPAQCVSHSGSNDCVEIRVPPLAAFALFGGAIAEANDVPISLVDVFPEATGVLLEQLRTTSTWEHRFAAVDRFLARGFAKSQRRIPPELTWAWKSLEQSHGQAPVQMLAREIGWSERHFINQFRVYFGVRPKSTARRLRFSYAYDMLSSHPSGDLSAIAARSGFSDQSHMTREFHAFAGVTPGILRTARFDDLPGIPAAVLLNP